MKQEMNLIGPKEWGRPINWDSSLSLNYKVLRPLLFFYKGQKTTYVDLSKYFTLEALIKFENDKFIEKI